MIPELTQALSVSIITHNILTANTAFHSNGLPGVGVLAIILAFMLFYIITC